MNDIKVSILDINSMLSCLGLATKELTLSEYWMCEQNRLYTLERCAEYDELVNSGLMDVEIQMFCKTPEHTYRVTKKGLEFLSTLFCVKITEGNKE